jgi:hypothetical protein
MLMVQVRFMVVREYSPSLHEASGEIELIQGELTRASLTSLAYASNVPGDPDANFDSAVQRLAGNLSASHFGLTVRVRSSSAALNWPPPGVAGDGYTVASVEMNVTSIDPAATWILSRQVRIDQKIIRHEVRYAPTLPGLLRIVIPLNLTVNGSPAKWQSSLISYGGSDYSAAMVKNMGNGRVTLEVFIPYSGPGMYHLRIKTWDVNGILVVSAFDLTVT